MQEFKDTRGQSSPSFSPEWELFRLVQHTNWTDLSQDPELATLDLYRSIELSLTLQNALASPKLRTMAEKHGKDMVCRLIGLVVRVYASRFPPNAGAPWGAWRLRQTAEWLYDTYTMESLRDMMYAFKRSQGKYVHDLSVIVSEYLDWRAAKLEEVHRARNRADVSEWPGELKQQLPDRWFLGYLTQPNGNKDQNHKQEAA